MQSRQPTNPISTFTFYLLFIFVYKCIKSICTQSRLILSQIRMGPWSSQGALGTTKQDFGPKRVAHLAKFLALNTWEYIKLKLNIDFFLWCLIATFELPVWKLMWRARKCKREINETYPPK